MACSIYILITLREPDLLDFTRWLDAANDIAFFFY